MSGRSIRERSIAEGTFISTCIKGIGAYLPTKTLSNKDLEGMVETCDEWVLERTGISKRHIAAPTEMTSDLALIAATRALRMANLEATDLQAIIVATATPNQTLPQSACILQRKLGATNAFAFDLGAACSGFVYGLSMADAMIRAQGLNNILVVGAETLSRLVDYRDRETCILFGDGAGAVILSRKDGSQSEPNFFSHLASDGTLGDLLTVADSRPTDPFQETRTQELAFIRMRGKEIFKSAVRALTDNAKVALEKAGLTIDDVTWFVPHQANNRIMQATATQLNIPCLKVVTTVAETGNTSSASIPIALAQHFAQGKLKRGDKILISAFGAGLTSGAAVFEF